MNNWWHEIKKEIKRRQNICSLEKGPLIETVYDLKGVNPYAYKNVNDFKERVRFNKAKDCVLANRINHKLDKHGRYFKNVNNKKVCDELQGHWAPNSISRQYRYENGTCWKDIGSAKCGAIIDKEPDLLRQRERLNRSQSTQDKLIQEKRKECDRRSDCTWRSVTNGYDCFSKDSIKDIEGTVNKPPLSMPTNPTDQGFEEFLYKWYNGKLENKAPNVLKSQGVGCDGSTTNMNNSLKLTKRKRYTKEKLAKMNPTNVVDGLILRDALGEEKYLLYVAKYIKAIKNNKIFKSDWSKLAIYEDAEDELIKTSSVTKQEKPSIAQSVVNMVMKNIAIKGSTARGLLALHSTGSGKCHAKDTLILMYDGSLKKVQDIAIGDQIMGDNSTPRTVLALGQGEDLMYDIVNGNEKYTVNSEHILCLKDKEHKNRTYEIEVNNYLKLSDSVKETLYGYRVGVDFESKPVNLEPYTFGLWLAEDETSIPDEYKCNDRQTRLKLLAGIIDGKGLNCSVDPKTHSYLISIQSNILINDIIFLARSLGFTATANENIITIDGLDPIPCFTGLLVNKTNKTRTSLLYPIEVKCIGRGKYYGFTLDGNHRYVMGDFTVTHNTCTATGVMDAFWDTNKDIVFVSSLDALASNPPFKFHECAQRFFPRWNKKSIDAVRVDFENRNVRFLSFAKLANRIVDPKKKTTNKQKDPVDLDNSILIIDEVHNLFRPLPNQKEKHRIVEKHLVNVEMHPSLKMVVLTATPGDNVEDTMKLINMIRDPVLKPTVIEPPGEDEEDLQRFIQDIRGLISYYDLSSDLSRFPLLINSEPEKYPMSKKQFDKYLDAYNKVKKEWRDYDKLAKSNQLGKWWIGARRYANMLYNFEKDMSLTEFSSKLPALLDNLEKQYVKNEKTYVYSAFHENKGSSHGILEIARQLEKLNWKPITMVDVKAFKNGKMKEGKRYMIASQKEKNFQEFIKIYNSDENKYGRLIGCMIATQNFNEGLDLKAVRHIHIFEPLVTMASDKQTLGRARRYCSHQGLDREKNEWTVKVWRYMATLGNYVSDQEEKPKRGRKKKTNVSSDGVVAPIGNESIDEIVYNESRERYKQLFDIGNAMRLAAIDRLLTENN